MDDIINRDTGKKPTPREWRAIKARALQIFRSPYAAPELIEWAIDVYPEGFAECFVFEDRPEWVEYRLLGGKP